jgi:hypothetical protein
VLWVILHFYFKTNLSAKKKSEKFDVEAKKSEIYSIFFTFPSEVFDEKPSTLCRRVGAFGDVNYG